MSTESDDALDDRLERIQIRAQNFRELLKDGEEVTIAFQDGEVHCEESYRSKFERQHPKLYGRLMSIDAQMAAGFSPYVFGLAVVGVVLFGLQLGWWTEILGERVCELLNGMWFFIAAPLFVGYLMYLACRRWGKYVYRHNRAELLDLIAASKLDRDVLLVMLRDEPDLDAVIHELKLDAGPFPPST
jgi:hypothetical protein